MGCAISEKAVLRIMVLILMGLHMVRLEVETMMNLTDNVLDNISSVGMGITSAVGNWTLKELQQEIVLRTGAKDEQIEKFIREENAILAAEDRRAALLASQRMKQADFQAKRVPARLRKQLDAPPANAVTKPLEAENMQAAVPGVPRRPEAKTEETPKATKDNAPAARKPANSATPRLELIHNSANAGHYLAWLALEKGVSWGMCHFNFPWRKYGTPWKDCPALKDEGQASKIAFWKYPIQRLKDLDLSIFPYDNMPDTQFVKRPTKYFVVVRNPYDRFRSLYHTHGRKFGWTKEAMNGWIQGLFQDPTQLEEYNWPGASPCQYHYLLDERTGEAVPDVDHMVQYEYLREDFNALMEEYNMPLSIPEDHLDRKINYNAKAYGRSKLTVSDFDDKTIGMINKYCELDFKLGRGYEMIKTEGGATTAQVRRAL